MQRWWNDTDSFQPRYSNKQHVSMQFLHHKVKVD